MHKYHRICFGIVIFINSVYCPFIPLNLTVKNKIIMHIFIVLIVVTACMRIHHNETLHDFIIFSDIYYVISDSTDIIGALLKQTIFCFFVFICYPCQINISLTVVIAVNRCPWNTVAVYFINCFNHRKFSEFCPNQISCDNY